MANVHIRTTSRIPFKIDDKLFLTIGMYASFVLLVVLPLCILVLWSFTDPEEGWFAPDLLPPKLSFAQWKRVFYDATLIKVISTSMFISIVVTILTGGISFPTAYVLARFPMRAKRVIEIFILSPLIIPGIVVGVGLGEMFFRAGLNYTVIGVVLVQMVGTVPFMIRILTAALEAIPQDLIHVSNSLGASSWQMVRTILLPLSIPGFLAGGLLSFIRSYEEFLKTFIVGAPKIITLPVKLFVFLDGEGITPTIASVVSLILLVPILIVFIVAGRIMRDDVLSAGMGKL